MNSTNLSKLPYKGTKDMYPEDMLSRNYIFDIWSRVAKRFGYEEYDTPLIEDANMYRVKSGDEIANTQLYSFTDKGGREIALRPEMTPSLARLVAQKRNVLALPVRWFNIGRYYRYEKPQKGRTREFFQLNIDILGVPTIEAEIEIIQYVMEVMKEFKAPKDTFELKINNRYLLDYLFEEILKISDQQKPLLSKAIDNYLKLESKDFEEYVKELGLSTEQTEKLLNYLNWSIADLEELKERSRGAKELVELFEKAKNLNIQNIKFSPYIVRGLQYYTGTVIEMFDVGSKENPRALFGGGRYDNLLEIFDEKSIPAFGLGWGDVTTFDYLKTYNLLPNLKSEALLFVTLMDDSLYEQSMKVANYLREKGVNTVTQLTPSKLSKQLASASKRSIPWVVIVGQEEVESGKVILKNMFNSEQISISLEEVPEKVL
jgi:histidyl-tRNA synthetase